VWIDDVTMAQGSADGIWFRKSPAWNSTAIANRLSDINGTSRSGLAMSETARGVLHAEELRRLAAIPRRLAGFVFGPNDICAENANPACAGPAGG